MCEENFFPHFRLAASRLTKCYNNYCTYYNSSHSLSYPSYSVIMAERGALIGIGVKCKYPDYFNFSYYLLWLILGRFWTASSQNQTIRRPISGHWHMDYNESGISVSHAPWHMRGNAGLSECKEAQENLINLSPLLMSICWCAVNITGCTNSCAFRSQSEWCYCRKYKHRIY